MLWGTEPRQATDARGGWPFVHVQNQRARRRSAREATGEPPRTLEELVHSKLMLIRQDMQRWVQQLAIMGSCSKW